MVATNTASNVCHYLMEPSVQAKTSFKIWFFRKLESPPDTSRRSESEPGSNHGPKSLLCTRLMYPLIFDLTTFVHGSTKIKHQVLHFVQGFVISFRTSYYTVLNNDGVPS